MTDREVFFNTVSFGKTDRLLYEKPVYGLVYMGVDHQGFGDEDHIDGNNKPVGAEWTDIWGTGWKKEYPNIMGFPKVYPLADPSALSQYTWPDPDDERIYTRIYERKAGFHADMDKVLCGNHRDTLWERSYMLVGMESMMDYFYSEPEYARTILHEIMDFQLGIAEHYIKNGVEMVFFSDDLGCQDRLLLSPKITNEFLAPEYKRIFDFYRNKGVLVWFHSCGHVEPLLEFFIELGVSILNPIQATANDLHKVINVTKRRMALEGGINAKILMDGSDSDIQKAVKDAVEVLGAFGGYFPCLDHGLPFPSHAVEVFKNAVTAV